MQDKKVKILFWADQVTPTGFSRVAHSIIEHLPEYYDVCAIGVNYMGDPHPYKHRIYPASAGGDIYGLQRFEGIYQHEKPDMIFMVNDAWVLNPILNVIRKTCGDKLPKIFCYVPVDAKDHDPDWYKNFDIVHKIIAYTQFGKNEILKAAPELEPKISVLPHGVDTSRFHRMPLTKRQVKAKLYPNQEDFLDSFVVLNAGRNQPRKKMDITMEAFKLFAEGKPNNVKLYMHTGMTDAHINVPRLAKRLGIDTRLIMTNSGTGVQAVPISHLNFIYNATDVGINTSSGEGFSLPSIEHSVTGAPQVVPNHSAMTELYYDCGLLVPANTKLVLDNIMTTGYICKPEDVAEKLEALYTDKDLYTSLSQNSIEKFSALEYSWKDITRRWVQLFEED